MDLHFFLVSISFFSCKNFSDSKEEKLYIQHSPELSPEVFELGVECLGGSVCTPVVEKVQYPGRVREHGSGHGIERMKASLVDLIVPQGEFEPGSRHGLARGIDSSKPLQARLRRSSHQKTATALGVSQQENMKKMK